MDASIFRAYDVRGVVGMALNADTARLIGRAIGGVMNEHGLREMAVGRDGRLSGAELAGALSDGLRAAGIDAPVFEKFATTAVLGHGERVGEIRPVL